MYILSFSEKFQSQSAKLSRSNPKLKAQIKKTVGLLSKDVKHPSLRFHKISGEDYWSVSVNKSIRIIAHWDEDKFYLLRIGTHEDIY